MSCMPLAQPQRGFTPSWPGNQTGVICMQHSPKGSIIGLSCMRPMGWSMGALMSPEQVTHPRTCLLQPHLHCSAAVSIICGAICLISTCLWTCSHEDARRALAQLHAPPWFNKDCPEGQASSRCLYLFPNQHMLFMLFMLTADADC